MARSRTRLPDRTARIAVLTGAAGVLFRPVSAAAAAPMNYLRSFGPRADEIAALTWALLILSILVIVIVSALVLIGVIRRRVSQPGAVRG